MQLEGTDEFVILASDGVFDVFDNEQVVRIARSAATPQEAANLLTSSAFHAGSLDNVTAVVVALRGYKANGQLAASPAEPFSRHGAAASSSIPTDAGSASAWGAADVPMDEPAAMVVASAPTSLAVRAMLAAARGSDDAPPASRLPSSGSGGATAGDAGAAAAPVALDGDWRVGRGVACARDASGGLVGRRARDEAFRHALWLDIAAH